ncbi:MAG: hypothetical protein NBV67_19585 [Tagaea sp.]|nr:hypothetical protein [Tagaea sp.]
MRGPRAVVNRVDAHVEKRDAGEDGFLHDEAPRFGVKPNRRLDAKAHLMEYERWNRDWARGSGDDPKGLAPEYESYIRDIDEKHGHDPGLIFARDLTQQVEKYHGNGGELAKELATRLVDRPDLQREYLGGEVPKAPPIGTFKPGGEEGVKAWIDQDRIANGLKPRYAVPVAERAQAPAPQSTTTAQPTATPRRGPQPPHAPMYAGQPPIGARDMGPVPPLTSIGDGQRPTQGDIERHEAFVRSARQLPGIGHREVEVLRHLWATEGGDWRDPRSTGASSGITNSTYRSIVAGGRVAGLERSWRPGDVPTELRPGIMRDYLNSALQGVGGSSALENIEDPTLRNAMASALFQHGPGGGGQTLREAIRRTANDHDVADLREFPKIGAPNRDMMEALRGLSSNPATRNSLLDHLANTRKERMSKGGTVEVGPGDLKPIERYRRARDWEPPAVPAPEAGRPDS